MEEPVLLAQVRGVGKYFKLGRHTIRAVDDVTFDVRAGETIGLVGESGCGKSTLARLMVQLHTVTFGHIFFEGVDLTRLGGEQLRKTRRGLQMIFQDPYSSLDPRMTVGDIIAEPLLNFPGVHREEREHRVLELLQDVGLSPRARNRYPHEFSSGQRQRVGIARALALRPRLIVCDEPLSALDVSVQAQIINLIQDIKVRFGLTLVFIAHDLSVIRHISDRVMVMYLGKIVEVGDCEEVFRRPRHPYTQALLRSVPIADPDPEVQRGVVPMAGETPSAISPPRGCHFHPRCPEARAPGICSEMEPALEGKGASSFVACHFAPKDST